MSFFGNPVGFYQLITVDQKRGGTSGTKSGCCVVLPLLPVVPAGEKAFPPSKPGRISNLPSGQLQHTKQHLPFTRGGIKRAMLEHLISIYVFISNLVTAGTADRPCGRAPGRSHTPSAQSCQNHGYSHQLQEEGHS